MMSNKSVTSVRNGMSFMQELLYVCPLNHFTPFGSLLLGKPKIFCLTMCVLFQNTVLYLAQFVEHSFENTNIVGPKVIIWGKNCPMKCWSACFQ